MEAMKKKSKELFGDNEDEEPDFSDDEFTDDEEVRGRDRARACTHARVCRCLCGDCVCGGRVCVQMRARARAPPQRVQRELSRCGWRHGSTPTP